MTVTFPEGGPGPAGPPIDTLVRPATAAAATYTPCRSGGPSAADVAVAGEVGPWLTGSLAGTDVNRLAESVSCARLIVATVAANGMDRQAAVIALATTIVESGMRNVAYGDRDSLGLYQQRPSQGWGSVAQVQDPVYATNAFLTALRRNFPNNAWQYRTAGVVAQGVQISAFPDRYEPQAVDGVQLVSRLWQDPPALHAFAAGSGSLARLSPVPCATTLCASTTTGLDANPRTSKVATGFGLFELQGSTGQVWRSTGVACSGGNCPGWTSVGRNPKVTAVVTGKGGAYQFEGSTGRLWQYTGSPCTSATSCTGWRLIDSNPATTSVLASAAGLFQYQASTGQLWRFLGQPCASAGVCRSWLRVATLTPGSQVFLGPSRLVAFTPSTGRTAISNIGCSTVDCQGWLAIDQDTTTTNLVYTATGLFKYGRGTHRIARWAGSVCSGTRCAAWPVLDANSSTVGIAGAGGILLQLHGATGYVWSYTGGTCNGTSCPTWVRIATRPGTTALIVTG